MQALRRREGVLPVEFSFLYIFGHVRYVYDSPRRLWIFTSAGVWCVGDVDGADRELRALGKRGWLSGCAYEDSRKGGLLRPDKALVITYLEIISLAKR